MASLFKNWRTTFERVEKFVSDKYFVDVNLTKMINTEVAHVTKIDHLKITTNSKLSTKDFVHLYDDCELKFNDMVCCCEDNWEEINLDTFTFGPTWSIHWFRVKFTIPPGWADRENHCVEFHWNSDCEVLVYSSSGKIIKGLNATHSKTSVSMAEIENRTGHEVIVYLQASCSDLFGAGEGGIINPPKADKTFKVKLAEIRLVLQPAVTLFRDLKLILQIAESLKETDRGYRALFAANQAVNVAVDLGCDDRVDRIIRAGACLDGFFRIGDNRVGQLTLHAMGHCHIDTAWLWRYGETRRKIARSWSSSLRLLEKYPNMTFVCSQAQQLDWLQSDYPDLFRQLQTMAERKQFVPVGGTWVEMDVNMPCCESLCRQFLYGQRFFRKYFGKFCNNFWLPDTFGYSPQLPQIMRLSRISRFMTQKLSWSLVNKFPHHTFLWKGLDGSVVLTHFPPGDSYSMTGKVSEMIHSATNFADKGRSSSLMYIYGHGDGGQGPNEEMLHSLHRLADCDGLPRVVHSSPDQFFDTIEKEDMSNLCTWTGELFLELHNGTYTTQRQLKLGNVHCEQMLRALEMMLSIAFCQPISSQGDANRDLLLSIVEQVEMRWKELLLGQFHDVLPGSSIENVCDDAYWSHQSLQSWCRFAMWKLASILNITSSFFINPTSWPIDMYDLFEGDQLGNAGFCEIPPHSIKCVTTENFIYLPKIGYFFNENSQLHELSNNFFTISVDQHCRIRQLRLSSALELGNLIPGDSAANQLVLYDDVPLFWDAWDVMDYHLETGKNLDSLPSYRLLEKANPLIGDQGVTVVAKFCLENSGTVIEQTVTVLGNLEYVKLRTKVLDWRETHRMLKVKIATVANAVEAQFNTQCGYHSRPTHRNTSWDSAKFEVCGHEWIHVGEANWGISVLKEAIFGSSVFDGEVYLSLLRSPTSPDATADKKHLPHIFNYAIYPYHSTPGSNHLATTTRLSTQFIWTCSSNDNLHDQFFTSLPKSIFPVCKSFPIFLKSPNCGEVAIDWIKPSCDNPMKIIMRLHEQTGGRYAVTLSSSLSIKNAYVTDILEEAYMNGDMAINYTTDTIEMFILPFKIVSILVDFGF